MVLIFSWGSDAIVRRFKEQNTMKEEDKGCRAWEEGRNTVTVTIQ